MANASTALPEKPHVLVTGASGLLGRAIVPQLKSGFRLRLSDRAEVVSEGADWVAADLLDEAQTTTLLDGVDAVVHLAIASMRSCDSSAASSSRLLSSYEELMLEVNIKGTAHLFEAARRAGVKKLVYVSSLTVCLGDRFRRNYSEQDQVDPQNCMPALSYLVRTSGRFMHGIMVCPSFAFGLDNLIHLTHSTTRSGKTIPGLAPPMSPWMTLPKPSKRRWLLRSPLVYITLFPLRIILALI